MSVSENIFYSKNDISISNSRFIVGSTTYAMNGVTSVKMGKKDPEYGISKYTRTANSFDNPIFNHYPQNCFNSGRTDIR